MAGVHTTLGANALHDWFPPPQHKLGSDFIADVRGLEGAQRKERLESVIEQMHLGPVLNQSTETLSKGFKRRVGLAQAILHDPDVLILDEPTDGLDPNQKYQVRELIRSLSQDKLVIISTHILEEVDAVCTRAIIIAEGRLLADDTPENLTAEGGGSLDRLFRDITAGVAR